MMTVDIFALFSKDQVLTPGDGQAYEDAIQRWADNAVKRAEFVVLPKDAQDVSKAILFAVENDLDLAIKGGGHSCSGASSSEGLVIDLRNLSSVVVDAEKHLITVGGGATWADVDREAAKFGLAAVGGTVNHTGVGGLTVGGGFGWLTGRYGLTIDNLVQAELVTSSGEILTCSETENSELFWGIRGAGSNFGPVTSFVFKGYPQPNPVWSGLLIFTPPQLEALISATATWAGDASEDESMMIIMACTPPDLNPALAVVPFFNGSVTEGKKRFQFLYDVGPAADMTREIPYEEMNALLNPMATHGDRKLLKPAALSTLDPALIQRVFEAYVKWIESYPEGKGSGILIELHNYKKLMSVASDATSFANRGPWFNVNLATRWKSPELDAMARSWSSDVAALIHEGEKQLGADLAGARVYSNYGFGDERVRDIFGSNYTRLCNLKAKYDANSVFHKWFPITPNAA